MEPMKNEQIVFRFSKNLKEQMRKLANSRNVALSDLIRDACKKALSRYDLGEIEND
jgi:hypothetical protein